MGSRSHGAEDKPGRVRQPWNEPKDEVTRTGRGQPGRGAGSRSPQKDSGPRQGMDLKPQAQGSSDPEGFR